MKPQYKLIVVAILILVVILAFPVFIPKKVGDRVGRIVTLEDHWMGQTEASLQVGEQGSNLFHFTIRDSKVKKQAEEVKNSRAEVNVRYREVFWSYLPADTKCFATDITTLKGGPAPSPK